MAATELMTWSKTQRRWLKKYRGQMYSVSPRQLRTERTKEASREAANDWWTKKQEELDKQAKPSHPAKILKHYREAEETNRLYAHWHRKYGKVEHAEAAEAAIEWMHAALERHTPQFPLLPTVLDPTFRDNEDIAGKTVPLDVVTKRAAIWRERYQQIRREERAGQVVPVESTIRGHIDAYLKVKEAQQKQGKIKLNSLQTLSYTLAIFKNWVSPDAPLESVTELLLQQFYLFLVGKINNGEMSDKYADSAMKEARAFVRSRWELRLIDLPRNLDSKSLSITVQDKAIRLFDDTEIAELLKNAPDRVRLYLLLALNCGFTASDIGTLTHSEVDWSGGRIVRARGKTREKSENVPVVDYRLWKATFALLKRFKSDDEKLVLVNSDGQPLWAMARTASGKINRRDAITRAYVTFCSEKGGEVDEEPLPAKPFKLLRKTAASKLEQHPEYGRYSQYFLGHVPQSVAEKHYVRPSKELFDAALKWLGQQFGIA